jgi:hypothetical protein
MFYVAHFQVQWKPAGPGVSRHEHGVANWHGGQPLRCDIVLSVIECFRAAWGFAWDL